MIETFSVNLRGNFKTYPMDFLKKIMIVILAIIIVTALSWLGLWAANIFNWLMSLPIGVLGLAFDSMPDGFLSFIYKFITFGLAYGAILYVVLCIVTREDSIFMDEAPWGIRIVVVLFTVFMIAVIDGFLDPVMPQAILNGMDYLREECGVYLLTPISWLDVMSGGSELGRMDYIVFNTATAIGGIASLFFNYND